MAVFHQGAAAMKILSCLLISMFLAAPAIAGIKGDAQAHSEAFQKAFNSRNVKAVVALYAENARAVWPGQGEEANGREEIRKLVEKGFKDAPKDAQVLFESQDVITLENGYFVVLGHWQQSFTGKDGKKVTLDLRTSEVLKRHDGKLLYLVDHASVGLPPPPVTGTSTKK
jgi:uncharacterized protein (TIGR02246 family)